MKQTIKQVPCLCIYEWKFQMEIVYVYGCEGQMLKNALSGVLVRKSTCLLLSLYIIISLYVPMD